MYSLYVKFPTRKAPYEEVAGTANHLSQILLLTSSLFEEKMAVVLFGLAIALNCLDHVGLDRLYSIIEMGMQPHGCGGVLPLLREFCSASGAGGENP